MTTISTVRAAAGAFLALIASAGILAGCSDNAASPLPPNSDPLGNNATVTTSDPVSNTEANAVRTNVRNNANDSILVTPSEAAATAAGQYPNAEIYAVNLDYDSDSVNYECVVRSNAVVYVVIIDPQTGKVIDKHQISNYYYTRVIVIRPTVVKVKEAKDRAKRLVNGDVVEVNMEEIEDQPTYIIIILTPDNRYVTLFIDADTGRERKLESNDRCQDSTGQDVDRHKNKRGRGHYRHGNGHGYGHYYHCECSCTDDNGQPTPSNVISADSASAVASRLIDSTKATKVELETKDSANIFYNVGLIRTTDSATFQVKLNAINGSLVSIRQTGGKMDSIEFQPRVTGDTLVALSVARTAAIAQVVGTLQGWKLEYDTTEAKWVYTFTIKETATGTTKEVLVDAKTGTFIRIK